MPGGPPLRDPQVTVEPAAVPSRARLLVYRPQPWEPEAPLTEDARRLGFEAAVPGRARLAVPAEGGPVVCEVPVAAVGLADALPVLLAGPQALPPWRQVPDSLRVWSLVARLGVAAVRRRLIAPTLERAPDGRIVGIWRVLVDGDPASRAVAERLAAALPPAGHAVAVSPSEVATPDALVRSLLDAIADLCARDGGQREAHRRPRGRLLPWTARWVEALTDPVDAEVPLGHDAEELLAGLAPWHASDALAHLHLTLSAPAGDSGDAGPWRLEFGLRGEDGSVTPAARVWEGLADQDGEAARLQEALLEGLGHCARVFPPLDATLAGTAPEGIDLDLTEAWVFLHEAVPLLAASDVSVTLPDELTDDALRLRLRLDADDAKATPGEAALLPGSDEEVHLAWEVTLAGEALDTRDVEELLASEHPLVHLGGRWVRVDEEFRTHLESLPDVRLTVGEGLLYSLAGSVPLGMLTGGEKVAAGPQVDVVSRGRTAALLERLREGGERPPEAAAPPGFVGELRPYQRRGVAWLQGMAGLGLGAVLADAMGLGKTVQLIAHLLGREPGGPHLVVCPTSVVGNWERELGRFAPGLGVTRFHGPDRPSDLRAVEGVVVTSYGLLRRDPDPLEAVSWDVVTLDETQHVKNPGTAGARAARRLRARQTIALTGTPLENRLSELWAVLDVTNTGLLGSRSRFARHFAAPIEQGLDAAASARLRRVVAPFVLRREKQDVLDDLPDKIEREVACTLTPEQATLYREAVERTFGSDALATASPMQRRGRVLALLTALKQICNHPAHYLGEPPEAGLLGRSGKLAVTREIIAEAVGAGDRVLVFTQFVEMGRLLAAQLCADLDQEVPFLHGGVAARARDRMVEAFEGGDSAPGVLLVSLRAGGTGLNLTAATHVVHYDRWWNPAVEDQATDRAHRIGQRRTVEVHKLLTAGTVEERIAALLERKRALADAVVSPGEGWVTELGEEDLRALVALGAPGEELDEDDPFEQGPYGPGRELWQPAEREPGEVLAR